MRQRVRLAALVLFAVFAVSLSIACGGGGGTVTTSLSPSPTPTPTPLALAGDWRMPYGAKVDGVPSSSYLYLKFADDGDLVSEHSSLTYPRTTSGSFSLTNAVTHVYTGSFTYWASGMDGPYTMSGTITVLSGSTATFLESSKTDSSISGITMTRMPGISDQAGDYIVDAKRLLGESDEYIVEKITVMHLAADGDFTFDSEPDSAGTSQFFRGAWFFGTQPVYEGETQIGAVQLYFSTASGKIDSTATTWATGTYRFSTDFDDHDGIATVYRATGMAYTMADFAHPWSAVHLDRGDGSVSQVTGIVIQSDGDIDPIPGTDVLGGTLTINDAATGKFTMSLTIDEGGGDTHVTTMSGMISPSLAYGTTIEVDTETEEITAEIYIFRADMPGWNYSLREGWWCTSPTDRVNVTMEDYSDQDMPLSVMTGHCGSDGIFDILPDLGDTSAEASIIMLDANTYSIMLRADSPGGSYLYWVVGTFLQPAVGTGNAYALVQIDTGMQGEGEQTAAMVRFLPTNTPISYFTGSYSVLSAVVGFDVESAVVAVSGTDLTFTFVGGDIGDIPVTYTTEWDETIPFMFRLYTMIDTTQTYLPGLFFLTPSEMSLFNGQFRFSDNELLWGIMLAD
ncbi:MAG: hypothetical protein WC712_03120 [Candidatus Brocadiia bacterium]